jgi:hypothetical protein
LQGLSSLLIKLFHRYFKAFVTAGAVDGMRALDTWQTECVFAVRTPMVNMGFAVTPFVFLQ